MKKIEEKIRLLLAKAESTEFEAERDTVLAAATKLMVKFGIEEAELRASGASPGEKIVQESVEFRGNYSAAFIDTGTGRSVPRQPMISAGNTVTTWNHIGG